MFTRILAKTGILKTLCMYASVEGLSETRYLNRSLSLSLFLSLTLSLSLHARASVCGAAAEHRKQSASPETRANDTLHSMVVKLIS